MLSQGFKQSVIDLIEAAAVGNTSIPGLTIHVDATIRVDFDAPPKAPRILGFNFMKGPQMAGLLGSVLLSPAAPDVTARHVTLSVGTAPSFVFDATDPAATFPCLEGDSVTGFPTDTNITGDSLAGASVTAIATVGPPPPPPPVVPATPTILGFAFVADPANP
jgi:hypothetical protein